MRTYIDHVVMYCHVQSMILQQVSSCQGRAIIIAQQHLHFSLSPAQTSHLLTQGLHLRHQRVIRILTIIRDWLYCMFVIN